MGFFEKWQNLTWRSLWIRQIMETLLLLLTVFMIQLLTSLVGIGFLEPMKIQNNQTKLMILSVFSAVCNLLWFARIYRKHPLRMTENAVEKKDWILSFVAALCIGCGGCICFTIGLSAVQVAFPQWFTDYNKVMEGFSGGNLWLTYSYVLLFGPVAEEFIFRGAIMDRPNVVADFWIANFIQAFLFGVYHMNLIQGLYAFVLGLALGLIRQATGSIFFSILAHISFNSTNVILGELFARHPDFPQMGILFFFFSGLLFFILGLWYNRTMLNSVKQKIDNTIQE